MASKRKITDALRDVTRSGSHADAVSWLYALAIERDQRKHCTIVQQSADAILGEQDQAKALRRLCDEFLSRAPHQPEALPEQADTESMRKQGSPTNFADDVATAATPGAPVADDLEKPSKSRAADTDDRPDLSLILAAVKVLERVALAGVEGKALEELFRALTQLELLATRCSRWKNKEAAQSHAAQLRNAAKSLRAVMRAGGTEAGSRTATTAADDLVDEAMRAGVGTSFEHLRSLAYEWTALRNTHHTSMTWLAYARHNKGRA